MNNNDAESFCQFLTDNGYKPRSYSGRGMFGKTCLGVCVDSSSPITTIIELFPRLLDCAIKRNDIELVQVISTALQDCWIDSMGIGWIIYFPNIRHGE